MRHLRGPGAVAARRVVKHADGRAANPFESVLRALCIEEGFELTPQVTIAESGLYAVVDLGSEALRLAVEADGFETHGTRGGLRKDCERHTLFAIYAYSSLRFAYEHVMFEPDWVRWSAPHLASGAGRPEALTDPPLRPPTGKGVVKGRMVAAWLGLDGVPGPLPCRQGRPAGCRPGLGQEGRRLGLGQEVRRCG